MRTTTEPATEGSPSTTTPATTGPAPTPMAAESTPPGADRGRTKRARPLLAVLALSISTFSFVTTEMVPIGLLPQIGADLDRSLSTAGLLVTAYAVVVLVVSLPLTWATRRFPKRLLLGGLLVVFTLSVLASAVAPSFGFLLAARIVTALAQALFWSVVTSTAVGLFPPQQRARVVSALFTGSSLAPVAGLPLGTWIGQQAGWRTAFVALSVLGAATCAVVVWALPTTLPEDEPARTGDTPDVRRYAVLLLVTALMVTGMFTAYTYVSAHLVDVAGLAAGAMSAALLLIGLVGLLGVLASGTVLAASSTPRASLLVPLATMAVAFWLLHLAGHGIPGALAAFALVGFAACSFSAGLAGRVLAVAPGSTDLASAGTSSAYNLGIGGGAGLGGLIVAGAGGVEGTALAAALLASAALLLMLAEPLLTSSSQLPKSR